MSFGPGVPGAETGGRERPWRCWVNLLRLRIKRSFSRKRAGGGEDDEGGDADPGRDVSSDKVTATSGFSDPRDRCGYYRLPPALCGDSRAG